MQPAGVTTRGLQTQQQQQPQQQQQQQHHRRSLSVAWPLEVHLAANSASWFDQEQPSQAISIGAAVKRQDQQQHQVQQKEDQAAVDSAGAAASPAEGRILGPSSNSSMCCRHVFEAVAASTSAAAGGVMMTPMRHQEVESDVHWIRNSAFESRSCGTQSHLVEQQASAQSTSRTRSSSRNSSRRSQRAAQWVAQAQQAAVPFADVAAAAPAAGAETTTRVAAANGWNVGSRRPPLPFPQQVMLHDAADDQDDLAQQQTQQQQQQQQQGDDVDVAHKQDQHQQLTTSKQQLPLSPSDRSLAPAFANSSSSTTKQSPVVPPTVESLKQLEQQQQQDAPEVSQLTWSASFRSSHCGSDGASTYFYSVHTASEIGSSSARYANIWEGLGQDSNLPTGLLAAIGAEDRTALLAAAAAAGRFRSKRSSSSSGTAGIDAAALKALQRAAGRLLQGGGRVPRPNVTGTALW
jgi:hypothetical protein